MRHHRGRKKSARVVRNRILLKLKNLNEEGKLAPHSFVIHRGEVTTSQRRLIKDFRHIMDPFTASSLKVSKANCIRDFVHIASKLNVSHLCAFTCTPQGQYLKICKLPQGPTVTFCVQDYSICREVQSIQRKQYVFEKLFDHAPLVVFNGVADEGKHLKLVANLLQHLFPTINLTKVNLNNIRRCLLFNYNPITKVIEVRHYAIKVEPTGLSKGVKKLFKNRVPNLSKLQDISELITKSGLLSDSEAEDDPASHVTLPQKIAARGNAVAEKSAIRLLEIGPRMTLQLTKIEAGLMQGEVLFHDKFKKSPKEKEMIRKRREAKMRLKAKRQREQKMNVKKKEELKDEQIQKTIEGMERKKQQFLEEQKRRNKLPKRLERKMEKAMENERLMRKAVVESHKATELSDDDDAEWYEKEVGEKPDSEIFGHERGVKRSAEESKNDVWKKPKLDKYHNRRFKSMMAKVKGSDKKSIVKRGESKKSFKGKKLTRVSKKPGVRAS